MQSINLNRVSKLFSLRNNTKSFAVAIIALLTISVAVAVLPAFAQKTYTAVPDRDTGTVVGTSPKLIGLGQDVLINIITYPAPSGPTYFAQDLVHSAGGFEGVSCTITKPDGTKETFLPIDETLAQIGIVNPGQMQIVGSLQFRYEPTQVGTYSITASFPGQMYTTDEQHANLNLSVYYKPSSTHVAGTFTVQEDIVLAGQLNGWPWSPLPTGYWERPVSVNNREWYAVSGNWLQPKYDAWGTEYNPYSTAPKAPHILWAKQVAVGGLVGGDWGSIGYIGTQNPWPGGPIVLSGRVYENDATGGTFSCTDLRTGELLWRQTGRITMGFQMQAYYQTAAQANEGGASAWLWDFSTRGSWKLFDPWTGALLQTITNVPLTSSVPSREGVVSTASVAATNVGASSIRDGDPVCYVTQYGGWNTTTPLKWAFEYLIKWNYTKVTGNNWMTGVVWNVSIIQPNGATIGDGRGTVQKIPYDGANVVVVRAHDDEQIMMGFDMTTGAHLWTNNNTILDIGVGLGYGGPNGPIILTDGSTNEFVAYNVKTGREQWRASTGELPWSTIPDMTYIFNDGVFYYGSYDGHVYAVDLGTGAPVWTSDYIGAFDEQIYNNNPFNGKSAGADGVLYFSTYSTYANQPRPRFQQLVAINQTTGKFLWTLPVRINPEAIAEGIILGHGGEDGMEYAIGKGKTTTTVSAPTTVVPAGTGALIQGTVMDLSPGQPNTPAVSDADMAEWMDYLHGQNATLINSPPVPDGVPVQLTAVASDGAVTDLGTVASNSAGLFAYTWESPAKGTYTIYATFAGSESYWSSYAATALSVGPAPETDNTQPTAAPDNTMLYYGLIAAVIVIVLAIAIATVLLLRKKP